MEAVKVNAGDLKKLIKEVEQIREMLIAEREQRKMEEAELTEWAENELKTARETPEGEYISHEEVKKKVLAK